MDCSKIIDKFNRSIFDDSVRLSNGMIIKKSTQELVGMYDTEDSIDETCRKYTASVKNDEYISIEEYKEINKLRMMLCNK